MADQQVSTGLIAVTNTGVLSFLKETINAAEDKVQVPPIGGQKTVGASLAVTPVSATKAAAETQQLIASLTDQQGRVQNIARVIDWSSASEAVCTVDGNGLVTAVATGGPANVTGTSHRTLNDACAITVS